MKNNIKNILKKTSFAAVILCVLLAGCSGKAAPDMVANVLGAIGADRLGGPDTGDSGLCAAKVPIR